LDPARGGSKKTGPTHDGVLKPFCRTITLFMPTTLNPEDHSRRELDIQGWPCIVETYKLGEVYHSTVYNADPGARIARADGSTRQEAESLALEKAGRYLGQTRRFPTT
jgi:hypothetical protein